MKVVVLDSGTLTTQEYPQKIYSGFITASGLGGGNKLPAGWSVTKPVAGRYRITHNLNLGINSDLRVTLTLFGNPPAADRVYIKGAGSDIFIVETDLVGVLTPSAFVFTAILI